MTDSRDKQPAMTDGEPSSMMFDRLRTLLLRRDEMWWEIGQLLDEVAMRADIGAAQESYIEYATRTNELSADDAIVLRRIAHHFSRDVATRFGIETLDALLDFLHALPCTYWATDPQRIEIPVLLETGDMVRLPLENVTSMQIRDATRMLASQPATSDTRIPRDVAQARDVLQTAMTERFDEGEVTVKIHHVADEVGAYTLAIEGIDPFNARAIGEVLQKKADELLALASES